MYFKNNMPIIFQRTFCGWHGCCNQVEGWALMNYDCWTIELWLQSNVDGGNIKVSSIDGSNWD